MSVRQIARDIAAQHDSITVQELAEKTVASLQDYDAALAEVMPVFVRAVIVTARMSSTHTETTPTTTTATGGPAQSWKVRQVREAWQVKLEAMYAVRRDGTYVRLGDMSTSDLETIAAAADEQAAALAAKAQVWRTLAARMGETGVARVRDLPDTVLADTLGGAS